MAEVAGFVLVVVVSFAGGIYIRVLHDTIDSYKQQVNYHQQVIKRLEKRIRQLEMRGHGR
jgi:hypothetical protein